MPRCSFIILFLLIAVSEVEGGAVLRGVVLANEDGGQPMGNVAVGALGGNPNNTDANGNFAFTFPKKNPGDTAHC